MDNKQKKYNKEKEWGRRACCRCAALLDFYHEWLLLLLSLLLRTDTLFAAEAKANGAGSSCANENREREGRYFNNKERGKIQQQGEDK